MQQNSVTTSHFKTYPKNERVKVQYEEIIKLNTQGPKIVHNMTLDYKYIFRFFNEDEDEALSRNLYHPLEKLKRINSLSMAIDDPNRKSHMMLRRFCQKLKLLSSLHILKLHFPFTFWISFDGIIPLASALRSLKNLSQLALNLTNCHWLNDDNLDLILQSLKKMPNLKSFELNLCNHNQKITEKSFKNLAQALKHQKSLKRLTLEFEYFRMKKADLALNFLTSCFQNQKVSSINRLKISLAELGDFPASSLHPFLSSLKNLQGLQYLDLDLQKLNIDVTALQSLSTSFKSIQNLKFLSLNLSKCNSLMNPEMEALSHCFESLEYLESLWLSMRSCKNIGDEALAKFSSGLEALTKLRQATLAFSACKKISDQGVESIINKLGGLPNLRSIGLYFSDCPLVKKSSYGVVNENENIKFFLFYHDKL